MMACFLIGAMMDSEAEAKEAERIAADWGEFVAVWGDSPQMQEALNAKKDHFNKILWARVKPY